MTTQPTETRPAPAAGGKGAGKKVGPLKAWQWVAVAGGVVVVWYLWRQHQANAATTAASTDTSGSADTSQPTTILPVDQGAGAGSSGDGGGGSTGGGTGPPVTPPGDITKQQADALREQIKDLQGELSKAQAEEKADKAKRPDRDKDRDKDVDRKPRPRPVDRPTRPLPPQRAR